MGRVPSRVHATDGTPRSPSGRGSTSPSTGSGPGLTLVVEGDIRLQGSGSGGGTITVEDQGKVRVYVKGNDSVTPYAPGNEKELSMQKNSE